MSHAARIYVDNAAATAVDEQVLAAMEPYWRGCVGNAGALHEEGVQAKNAINDARQAVAKALDASPNEIIFTSGGTESNNLAIVGLVRAVQQDGVKLEDIHIITSAIEHSSVLDCFRALEREGVQTSYIPVDQDGNIVLERLEAAIRPETIMVSVIHASNEVGTIENLQDIAKVIREARKRNNSVYPLLHTDASQGVAWLSCNVKKLGVDMLTLDAQKLHGPKGVGCLYRAQEVKLAPILYGGGQEFGLRPGTPPTPLIVGFAEALKIVEDEREMYVKTVVAVRDHFIECVEKAGVEAELNGPRGLERLANNVNFSFIGLDAEQIVLELDARGVAASTRSACLTGNEPGSYVVAALGKDKVAATSAVRFSFNRHITREQADYVADRVLEVVRWLRKSAGIDR